MGVAAWAIGPLTFGAPALLWGLAIASAPIVIHLMLRPRPRRQPFPAMRFILQTHHAADRTNRLRRLLLLAMRALIIVLIAALLAQPRLRAARWVPSGGGPLSVAVCIDDSASMGYRFEGKTRLDVARQWAQSLLNDRGRFGEGSEFVVLTARQGLSGGAVPVTALTTSRQDALRLIDAVTPGAHDAPVGQMVRRADALLAKARHPRREVYVFSDSTVHAWRDMTTPPAAMTSTASVFCVDVGVEEDLNASLTVSSFPAHPVPVNAPIHFDATVRVAPDCRAAVEPTIEVRVDDEPRTRWRSTTATAPSSPAGGQVVNASLTLPGLPMGLHRIAVELRPTDPLDIDNTRFACVEVGALPQVAVVGEPADPNSVASLVAAMLAPPSLPADRQRVRLVRLAATPEDAAVWAGARCVFLADVPAPSAPAWRALTGYVRNGGVLAVILGDAVRPQSYEPGVDLLPALPVEIVSPPEPVRLVTVDASSPLLLPFAGPAVDSLGDRLVFRLWTVQRPAAQAAVTGSFDSIGPGLLERTVGSGRCVLLTFSPQREWSEFAAQAAPMMTLLHRIVEIGAPAASRFAHVTVGAGKAASIAPPAGTSLQVLRVPAPPGDSPTPVKATTAGGRVNLPTDRPGHAVVTAANRPQDALYVCAVNVPEEESDLRRLPADQIAGRFAPGVATAVRSVPQLRSAQRRQRMGIDAALPVGLLLLGLLLAESAFANRFYKRVAASPTAADGSASGRHKPATEHQESRY